MKYFFIVIISNIFFFSTGLVLGIFGKQFLPKHDLAVVKEFDLVENQLFFTEIFELKHTKYYQVGTWFEIFTINDFLEKEKSLPTVKMEILDSNDKIIFSKFSDDYFSPFFSEKGNGIILFRFSVPKEVPLKQDLRCRITVINNHEFFLKHGEVKFFIQKENIK